MKQSVPQLTWSSGSLTMMGAGILMGCTIYFTMTYISLSSLSKPKIVPVPKKKKEVVTPPWAIKKAKELEPPPTTQVELEALEKHKPRDRWNTVIFFPDLLLSKQDSPTQKLIGYFKQARISIQLCMYVCSHVVLSDAVRDMYRRKGLLVQVVTEYDTWTAHNNYGLKCLEKAGIEVRLNTNGYMMHNKFAIIDEEAVLTGSLNWTKQGVTSNNENVMITTDPRIVSKYVEEFNRLWSNCKSSAEVTNNEQ